MTKNIVVPNLEECVVQRLKRLAWQNGLPLEESLRRLLVEAAYPHERAAAQHKVRADAA